MHKHLVLFTNIIRLYVIKQQLQVLNLESLETINERKFLIKLCNFALILSSTVVKKKQCTLVPLPKSQPSQRFIRVLFEKHLKPKIAILK